MLALSCTALIAPTPPSLASTMSEPSVNPEKHAPAEESNSRKRAHSPDVEDEAAARVENPKPAKRPRAAAKPKNIQVDLTGPFNLLRMNSTFGKEYAPNGTDATNPETLYNMLLERQEENEGNPKAWTVNINIPTDYKTNRVREDVRFLSDDIWDTLVCIPFDLVLTNFKAVNKHTFISPYRRPTPENGECNAPGLKAVLKIREGSGKCGINSSGGTFTMRPLWRKVGDDGEVKELFEGNFAFKARFGPLYSKKGHGKGISESIDFWAIRGTE